MIRNIKTVTAFATLAFAPALQAYLVAQTQGGIVGYCYAAAYRSRPAYRYTLEDSVYLADGMGGMGLGTALLGELIARCEAGPWRQMLAIVGDSANLASIALHKRLGFEFVGTLRSVGFKFGRWVDTPLMQRALGAGDSRLPGGAGKAVGPSAARSQDFLYGEDGMPE